MDRKRDREREIHATVFEIREIEKRRASMLVSRGNFDEEIYRVR